MMTTDRGKQPLHVFVFIVLATSYQHNKRRHLRGPMVLIHRYQLINCEKGSRSHNNHSIPVLSFLLVCLHINDLVTRGPRLSQTRKGETTHRHELQKFVRPFHHVLFGLRHSQGQFRLVTF